MDELVKDTLDITEGYLREKRITVERELEHGIPEVLADVAQMKQVFLNLLKNAAESMPGGGTVRVGVCTEGDWVRIRFADTGEGMSSEVMEKLFTPFFTTKSAGTGVGLAISHKIIDDHDGRFNVSSTEGSGSVFSIFIPLHRKGQEARKGGKQ
jgi:signal transduction histidine kinase